MIKTEALLISAGINLYKLSKIELFLIEAYILTYLEPVQSLFSK